MYRTIVVPLDGSPLAERVLPYAEALARASGARLVLLQAPVARVTTAAGEVDVEKTRHVHEAEAYLEGVAARLAGSQANQVDVGALAGALAGHVAVETAIAYGAAGDAIVEAARDRQADLIAMATHGRSGLGRWLYGSVADHVLRHAETPVLLVPATGKPSWPAGERRRILVPLDGSDVAREVVDPASELATALGAELLLLRVVEPTSHAYEVGGVLDAELRQLQMAEPPLYAGAGGREVVHFGPEAALQEAQDYLEGVAGALRTKGHTVRVYTEVGAPAATIAQTAREQRAGVIAMATHGRSGLARLVLGSVATGTLQRADVPLMLVRPAALTR